LEQLCKKLFRETLKNSLVSAMSMRVAHHYKFHFYTTFIKKDKIHQSAKKNYHAKLLHDK